jgi:hypothetical protein
LVTTKLSVRYYPITDSPFEITECHHHQRRFCEIVRLDSVFIIDSEPIYRDRAAESSTFLTPRQPPLVLEFDAESEQDISIHIVAGGSGSLVQTDGYVEPVDYVNLILNSAGHK